MARPTLALLLPLLLVAGTVEGQNVSTLVTRAREARYQQDSTLASYEAIARQRMSAGIGLARGMGIGPIAPERLAARVESVARVGWHHSLGAWGEIIAARSVAPIVGETEMQPEDDDIALVLPYYPGRDRLWPVSELRAMLPRAEDWIIHPLEAGADSMYAFALGDSLNIRLPDNAVVRVREIRVRPRRPQSRLVVGSLWVDVASGSLVRAAYRPSVPMDLWPLMEGEISRNDREKVSTFGPFTGIIREVVVEHALYERGFWLPRTRIVSAEGTAKMGRVTLTIEQTFRYDKVTALASGERSGFREPEPDVDPRTGRVRRPVWRNVEERTGRCRERDDTAGGIWSADSIMRDRRLTVMVVEGVRFRVLLPCRTRDLVSSPELPKSIYEPSEKLFTDTDLGALRKDVEGALAIGSQAEWEPQKPTLHFGVERGLLRYNRVEGLSAGVSVERVLGSGYTVAALARLGLSDLYPNVEGKLERSNVRSTLGASAYRRLVAANDWGNPLGLGASAVAAVFGRDDGFYYRAIGADVGGTRRSGGDRAAVSWRLFGERHTSASVETHESLARLVSGRHFPPNIMAREGTYVGGVGAFAFQLGQDPRHTRLTGTWRAEGAAGMAPEANVPVGNYGRYLTEHTLYQGLGDRTQGSLTLAGGTSSGTLPAQRLWYLGGAYTVRGYRAGEMAGDAFWIGRAEIARGFPLIRPALFADAGWAGLRTNIARQTRPLVGVGVGAAAMDGLLRLDISRGLERDRRWRLDFYLNPR